MSETHDFGFMILVGGLTLAVFVSLLGFWLDAQEIKRRCNAPPVSPQTEARP